MKELKFLKKNFKMKKNVCKELSEIQTEQLIQERNYLQENERLREAEVASRDESIELDRKRIEQERKKLDLERHAYEMEKKTFDTQLQYEKDLIEARMQDELSRRNDSNSRKRNRKT